PSTTWTWSSRSPSGSACFTRDGSSPRARRRTCAATPTSDASTSGSAGDERAPRMTGRLLDVREIETAYGVSRVLFGVSIQVGAGECVCLLGRNGVGKTTTMRSIMGLTPPHAGRIVWKGTDITGWPAYRVARAGIGFVPEDRRIFADLTVWENLDVA